MFPPGAAGYASAVRPRRCATLLALPLTLAACGGSSHDATPPKSAGVASKTPEQILAGVSSALAAVHSYHLDGTETDKDGKTRLTGDVSTAGQLRFRIKDHDGTLDLIVLRSATYLRANRAFWASQGHGSGDRVAAALAGRWVKATPDIATGLTDLLKQTSPQALAHCVSHNVGTLSKSGTRMLDGRQVIVITDKGDKPGGAPGKLYVPTSGPALPARVAQTGPGKPGGKVDKLCDDPTSTTTASDYRLSRYGKKVNITPPRGAIDLSKLQDATQGLSQS